MLRVMARQSHTAKKVTLKILVLTGADHEWTTEAKADAARVRAALA